MQRLKWRSNIASLLLALFPILVSYVSSFSLNYGEISMVVFFFVCIVFSKSINCMEFPSGYIVFWAVVAILLTLSCNNLKITYLIPGGISFTIFSIGLGCVNKYVDFQKFYKYLKILVVIAIIIQLLQNLGLLPPKYTGAFILPISPHIGYDLSLNELLTSRIDNDRPCSTFLEPAYFAEFLLIFFTVESFRESNRRKLFTPMSLIVMIALFVLQSGLGLSCLAIILIVKFFELYRDTKTSKITMILLILVAVIAVNLYLQSESGAELLSRTEELDREGSSGFVRIFQGMYIFEELPFVNKLIGTDMGFVENMNLPFVKYNEEGVANLFTNGLFTLLIKSGQLGAVCLLFVYIKIYHNGNKLSKAILLLLLSMSLVEQVYLTSSMLLCTVIAYQGVIQKKNENSIFITNRPV